MNWLVFAAAMGAVVIFGGSAIATKVAISAISPLDVSIMRTVIGGLIAIPLAFALRIKLPASVQQKSLLLLSGGCGFIGFPLLFTFGVSLAWLILSENLSLIFMLASSTIMVGVVLAFRAK